MIRCLTHQYIQLVNLEQELEHRNRLLAEASSKPDSMILDLVSITQDYSEDIYRVDLSQLYSLPTPRNSIDKFEESIEAVFLCDRSYFKAMNSVLALNEAKREILKDASMQDFLVFLQKHIPGRIAFVKEMMGRNIKAITAFQAELKNIFGSKFKERQYGDIYVSNGGAV